ncbi:hypothetical protein HYC85_032167 [Camellia sinensis]|uniref:Uncharacterized protein n=1 Tax=Camellia sinensis TaxID=4442 RepID=A0A7J7FWJ7_CAMSI|nr:hypothetical protein HYC85_032167 [Camellia sinensis]
MACWVVGQTTSLAFSMLRIEPEKKERELISGPMSGFKFLMVYLENTGGSWVWHSTALFFRVSPEEGTGATMSDDDDDQVDSNTKMFDGRFDEQGEIHAPAVIFALEREIIRSSGLRVYQIVKVTFYITFSSLFHPNPKLRVSLSRNTLSLYI